MFCCDTDISVLFFVFFFKLCYISYKLLSLFDQIIIFMVINTTKC